MLSFYSCNLFSVRARSLALKKIDDREDEDVGIGKALETMEQIWRPSLAARTGRRTEW